MMNIFVVLIIYFKFIANFIKISNCKQIQPNFLRYQNNSADTNFKLKAILTTYMDDCVLGLGPHTLYIHKFARTYIQIIF